MRMRRFEIQIISRLRGLPTAAQLRRWLAAAIATPAEITLRVVNGAEARILNRDYRNRDYATNVLTFAYGGTPPAADIVLCAPVVAREAREQQKPLLAHYAHLCIHGALHASGMDHQERLQATDMENREIEILGTLGFDNPYVPAPGRAAAPVPGRSAAGALRHRAPRGNHHPGACAC